MSTRAAKYNHAEIDNSCLRICNIGSETFKMAGPGDERRITEFQYSETSVMNNVDEDKEAISECEMSIDKSDCVPFVPAVQNCDQDKVAGNVDMMDDNALKFETCLNLTKVPEGRLDKTNSSPGCKQFTTEGNQDQLIRANACTTSPNDMKLNGYDMSANSKVQQSGNQLQYQQFLNASPMPMDSSRAGINNM